MAGTLDVGDIRATDVAAALAGQYPALGQLAHHLLGEERVPGGPLGDDRRQLADRGIGPQQLTQQRRGVRITQWAKRYRLRAGHPRQRSLVFGAGGDQHHRRGARNDGQEVGQHRLADRIDPVRILDDEQRRFGARQRCRVDQCGQPAPPRIRVDLGQRHIGVGDAEQIIEQQQILRVGIRKLFPDPGAGGWVVEVGHAASPPAAAASRHGTGPHGRAIRRRPKTPRTPRPAASAAASRATRLLPMPGDPTTFTTPPRPPSA